MFFDRTKDIDISSNENGLESQIGKNSQEEFNDTFIQNLSGLLLLKPDKSVLNFICKNAELSYSWRVRI